ncbi:hypothetical protein F5144DRAFT_136476 [Chaetomium tenue]|uniref:Uncharacterized protein n=1 Tax=Chaetomium tenue TaxID=1854479 RepID=A0ACB7PKH4_9PEZI|nr:hypothetical protein F5144DRAFT_136476 [Chaetomium globosum]
MPSIAKWPVRYLSGWRMRGHRGPPRRGVFQPLLQLLAGCTAGPFQQPAERTRVYNYGTETMTSVRLPAGCVARCFVHQGRVSRSVGFIHCWWEWVSTRKSFYIGLDPGPFQFAPPNPETRSVGPWCAHQTDRRMFSWLQFLVVPCSSCLSVSVLSPHRISSIRPDGVIRRL